MPGYLAQLRDREEWLARRRGKARRIVAVLRAEDGLRGRVLDVGCSVGTTLALLAAERVRAVGVDTDVKALREARRELGSRAALVLASADRLPFRDGAFSALVANHVLEYVDQERAVADWGRVLAPDGPLYLAAVNRWKFLAARPFRGEMRRRVLRRIHHGEDAIGDPRTLRGLRRLFSDWRLVDWSRRILLDEATFGPSPGRWARWIPGAAWPSLSHLAPSWIFVARRESHRAPLGKDL